MKDLYPLKFEPILKEKVWGGNTLYKRFNKGGSSDIKIGESWELSGLQGDLSVVSNGYLEGNNIEEIAEVYMGDLLGDEIFEKFGSEFPLLFKLIDAQDKLSIQVHPDDTVARERHNAYGKSEMWYILEAEKEAKIYAGFKKQSSKNDLLSALENRTIDRIMNVKMPQPGDLFYIPAGRVHTIGPGVVLAEIQQTSDVTYRIDDWGRPGIDGNPRELHFELAEDVIDYTVSTDHFKRVQAIADFPVELVTCRYFSTNIIKLEKKVDRDYSNFGSFVVYLALEGSFEIEWNSEKMMVNKGETVLIPAMIENLVLKASKASLLEIYIDTDNLKEI